MCQNLISSQCTRVCASLEAAMDRMITLQTILEVEIFSLLIRRGR